MREKYGTEVMKDFEKDQVYQNIVSGGGKYDLGEQETTYHPTIGHAIT